MNKKYHIRVYIPNEEIGIIVNEAVDTEAFELSNSFDGVNGMLAIYDGYCSSALLKYFISFGVKYFPLNNYGDFVITCPNCGERIDDDMILLSYDENVLSGFNINCHRDDCGCQMADIKYKND
jgi:hypothetical protein